MDRRKVLSTSGAAAVAALAGCATGGGASSSSGASRTVFSVAQPMLPIAGSERDVPGAPHLLHRPQLRRACARDGIGSEPRAAVLLPEAHATRSSSCAVGTTADHPYPPLTKNYHYEIELVAALGKGGRNMPVEQALSLRLRLHDRPRHDAARPAARDGRREEAVGDRQELRPLGADGAAAPRRRRRPLHQGRDLAQGQRRRQAERRPQHDDVERRRADQQALAGVRADSRAT